MIINKYQIELISVFLILPLLIGCEQKSVEVELREIKDNLVLFDVYNKTEKDIKSIEFELVLLDNDRDTISLTPVEYNETKDSNGQLKPFVQAGGETFFATKIDEAAAFAAARVVRIEYW